MSLARQLLVLQLAVVAIAVAIAGVFAVRSAQDRTGEQQRLRVLSVGHSLAESQEVRSALRTGNPSKVLQPLAERVRRTSELGFVVFMTPGGRRHSHPVASRIGGRFVGRIAPAQAGRAFTETRTGTLGPSVRAVVPIRDGRRITGLVAVGVLEEAIAKQASRALPDLLLALALALVVGSALCMLLARRVRRQTMGLDPQELATLYQHHDAVLHAIREGVVVVGRDGRLLLVNEEARRLLDLAEDAVGRPVDEAVGDPSLAAALRGRDAEHAELHVPEGRVVVSSHREAKVHGRHVGTVTTLRDRTELEGLVRELTTVRGLADALRAQAHEAANELHTVVGLVELGRYEDAVSFATRRIGVTQDEVDLIQRRIGDPALVALLLGKASLCRERGVELRLDEASDLPEGALDAEDVVTIVGNLIDNALDAVATQRGGRIEVLARVTGGEMLVRVRDDGPGLPADALERVFEPGWSTKPGEGAAQRGLGLALVQAAAQRLGGTASAANEGGAVFTVRVPARQPAPITPEVAAP